MFLFFQRLLRQFGTKTTLQKLPNIIILKTIDERVISDSSIPDVTVFNEIIDTSSLFYDQLFGIIYTDNSVVLNSLEKNILFKVETVLSGQVRLRLILLNYLTYLIKYRH